MCVWLNCSYQIFCEWIKYKNGNGLYRFLCDQLSLCAHAFTFFLYHWFDLIKQINCDETWQKQMYVNCMFRMYVNFQEWHRFAINPNSSLTSPLQNKICWINPRFARNKKTNSIWFVSCISISEKKQTQRRSKDKRISREEKA